MSVVFFGIKVRVLEETDRHPLGWSSKFDCWLCLGRLTVEFFSFFFFFGDESECPDVVART